jgi:potassium-transporting ATPase KdpC subunit
MKKQIKPAIRLLIIFTILTGIIYPALITGLAQLVFPERANGSLIWRDGQPAGSILIGQQFDDPKYFWGRPSATSGTAYQASASGGSNYSVLNPQLQSRIEARIADLKKADQANNQPVPVDLVTASASGLDPDISVAAAQYQAARVANTRGLTIEQVNGLIGEHTQNRVFGILGEKKVNVLQINLALDKIKSIYD